MYLDVQILYCKEIVQFSRKEVETSQYVATRADWNQLTHVTRRISAFVPSQPGGGGELKQLTDSPISRNAHF